MGHLFVTRGDITKLACDAWLLPCDGTGRVNQAWTNAPDVEGLIDGDHLVERHRAKAGGARVGLLRASGGKRPAVWFGDTGGTKSFELEWYVDAIEAFAAARHRPPASRRTRPLLAIPFIGSGAGGQDHARGALLEALLPRTDEIARRYDTDVVFVAFDDAVFTAAQAVRRRAAGEYWGELTPALRAEATMLARHAVAGNLVVFFGAGISLGAGLPTWNELIEELAAEAGIRERLGDASERLLDWAAVIEAQLGRMSPTGKATSDLLRRRIAARFGGRGLRPTLAHSLLAALPVHEFATMNYDSLFEAAALSVGRPVAVLPWDTARKHNRWLLKMHGSVEHAAEIVLTRTDYLRYSATRGALRGLVQALLITRHMLFVGFSLADDNFHRIADDVRRAIRQPGSSPAKFGTALSVSHDPLTEELWGADLDILSLHREGDAKGDAGWRLDVFLDHLLAEATTVGHHLVDDRFTGMLTDEEKRLRCAVNAFAKAVEDSGVDLASWPVIDKMLASVGMPTPDRRR